MSTHEWQWAIWVIGLLFGSIVFIKNEIIRIIIGQILMWAMVLFSLLSVFTETLMSLGIGK